MHAAAAAGELLERVAVSRTFRTAQRLHSIARRCTRQTLTSQTDRLPWPCTPPTLLLPPGCHVADAKTEEAVKVLQAAASTGQVPPGDVFQAMMAVEKAKLPVRACFCAALPANLSGARLLRTDLQVTKRKRAVVVVVL